MDPLLDEYAEAIRPDFKHIKTKKTAPIVVDRDADGPIEINQFIARYLKKYQVEGVTFMYNAYKFNRGCILADEMGLGKTIQVIAFIATILDKKGFESDLNNTRLECIKKEMKSFRTAASKNQLPFLIVVPASILYNWVSELETWGYFAIGKFHGPKDRQETLTKLKNKRLEIVMTTHETCRINLDVLNKIEWSAVIVDEFHRLKNHESQISQEFRKFKTRTRIGLSGTILHNNLMELWSLLDWVNPGCLGEKSVFRDKCQKPILAGQRQNATKSDLAIKVKKIKEFKAFKQQYILRRTKQIIADQLPKKTDQVVYCQLTPFQNKLFKLVLQSKKVHYLLTRKELCDCGRSDYLTKQECCYKGWKDFEKSMILGFLNIFLKMANHPALLMATQAEFVNKLIKDSLGADFMCENFDEFSYENMNNCGKLKVLESMLEVFEKQNLKVLLFSYSTKILDILQKFVISKNYSFTRLDGTTKNSDRLEIVNKFNRDKKLFLFLISTKAGGVGLNITGANIVVIFDPNWNPTTDMQAQDRAFRIGQLKDVHVYRLITSGTIEENIYLRQIYKTHLIKECVENENTRRLFVLSYDNKKGEIFGIENLFKLNDDEEMCETRKLFQRYMTLEKGVAGLQISNYVDLQPAEERAEESDDEFDDEDDAGEDGPNAAQDQEKELKTQLEKIFKKSNVVHIHSNNELIKPSRIEKHLRDCAEKEADNIGQNQSAFACKKLPIMNTLDHLELNQADFEFTHGDRQQKFQMKNSNSTVVFGKVPMKIRKAQFAQMAKKLRIDEEELAENILEMSKEERFAGLKAFYLMAYPDCAEFYESFGRPKRSNSETSPNQSGKKLKSAKVDEAEPEESDEPNEPHVDFYEDMSTFQEVFDFIDQPAPVDSKQTEPFEPPEPPKPPEASREELFESLDRSAPRQETPAPATSSEAKDHYDLLLDELFN